MRDFFIFEIKKASRIIQSLQSSVSKSVNKMCSWEFVYFTMREIGLTESMLRPPNYRGVRIYHSRRCNRYYALFPDGSQLYSSTGGMGATKFKIPPSDQLTPERQQRILEQVAKRVQRENASVQRQDADYKAKHFPHRVRPVDCNF
ncbi:hypothetical protein BCIN_09g04260 [Botrytis cinerea B05.10]|uniref:Uncharacterized protein n=1 Tax=Botryotinia fuckeliana (strain B05.10) TaxID=332648 RepID=A0A384JSP6_BOTFB|nr:hypothetical protein BCIN_09g04260 [Botrytis cinerea B05.10]ATZ53616.1 hypothetical protein BCIN_09g04260 [Botrytis cinerea B05.10]